MTLSALQLEIYLNFTEKIVKELKSNNKKVTRKEIINIFTLKYALTKKEVNAIITEYLRIKKTNKK